jgi:integrase
VLGDDELKALWQACDGIGAKFGAIVRLLILTGQRRDEVAGMRWSELDLAAKIWTLPRERAKNDTEHAIPLSEQALAVIEGLPSERRGLIFTVTGETHVSGFSRPKRQLDALIEKGLGAPLPHWVFHDIRRSVASGLARLGQPVHVTEAVLNHRSGTNKGIARIYNRYDYASEKRGALEAWGRYVQRLVSGEPAGNVVELAAARG